MSPHERHAHGPSHDSHHAHRPHGPHDSRATDSPHESRKPHKSHTPHEAHEAHGGDADSATPIAGAVITVSDRSAAGEREDVSGPLAAKLLAEHGIQADVRVVPDGERSVHEAILAAIGAGARVVLTTGGTGVGPRDRTPEGTAGVLDLELPGLAQAIRDQGARVGGVASACLSRGMAGVVFPDGRAGLGSARPSTTGPNSTGPSSTGPSSTGPSSPADGAIAGGGAVVVNAPGSPGGVRDAVAVLGPLAAHLVGQLDGGDH